MIELQAVLRLLDPDAVGSLPDKDWIVDEIDQDLHVHVESLIEHIKALPLMRTCHYCLGHGWISDGDLELPNQDVCPICAGQGMIRL